MIKQLSNTNGVPKLPTAPKIGNHGALYRLDDTYLIVREHSHPEGCLWKTTTPLLLHFIIYIKHINTYMAKSGDFEVADSSCQFY